jgi:hypothetical protein
MKVFFLVSTSLLISLFASSQGPADFGVFVGAQMTNSNYSIQHVKQDTKGKYGVQAGVLLKVPFEGRLSFAPEAFYSLKGYKVTFNRYVYPPDPQAADNDVTIHCFELAPLLQFDFGTKPSHFFLKAGPSLDFQLMGREKYNLRSTGSVNRKMKFGPGEYGPFSANLLAQFGFETASGFLIFAQYTHGAASINNADGGPAIRHRAFGISIGKYLKKSKIVEDTHNRE